MAPDEFDALAVNQASSNVSSGTEVAQNAAPQITQAANSVSPSPASQPDEFDALAVGPKNITETTREQPLGQIPLSFAQKVEASFGSRTGVMSWLKNTVGYKDVAYDPDKGVLVLDKDGLWKQADIHFDPTTGEATSGKGGYLSGIIPSGYEIPKLAIQGLGMAYGGGIGASIGARAGALTANPLAVATSGAAGAVAGAAVGNAVAKSVIRMAGRWIYGTNVPEGDEAQQAEQVVGDLWQGGTGYIVGEGIGAAVSLGKVVAGKGALGMLKMFGAIKDESQSVLEANIFQKPAEYTSRAKDYVKNLLESNDEITEAVKQTEADMDNQIPIKKEEVSKVYNNNIEQVGQARDLAKAQLDEAEAEVKGEAAQQNSVLDTEQQAAISQAKEQEKINLSTKKSAHEADIVHLEDADARLNQDIGAKETEMGKEGRKGAMSTQSSMSQEYTTLEKVAIDGAGKSGEICDTSKPGITIDKDDVVNNNDTSMQQAIADLKNENNLGPSPKDPSKADLNKNQMKGKGPINYLLDKINRIVYGSGEVATSSREYFNATHDKIYTSWVSEAAKNKMEIGQYLDASDMAKRDFQMLSEKYGVNYADLATGNKATFGDANTIHPTYEALISLAREMQAMGDSLSSKDSDPQGRASFDGGDFGRFFLKASEAIRDRIRGEIPELRTINRAYAIKKGLLDNINANIIEKNTEALMGQLGDSKVYNRRIGTLNALEEAFTKSEVGSRQVPAGVAKIRNYVEQLRDFAEQQNKIDERKAQLETNIKSLSNENIVNKAAANVKSVVRQQAQETVANKQHMIDLNNKLIDIEKRKSRVGEQTTSKLAELEKLRDQYKESLDQSEKDLAAAKKSEEDGINLYKESQIKSVQAMKEQQALNADKAKNTQKQLDLYNAIGDKSSNFAGKFVVRSAFFSFLFSIPLGIAKMTVGQLAGSARFVRLMVAWSSEFNIKNDIQNVGKMFLSNYHVDATQPRISRIYEEYNFIKSIGMEKEISGETRNAMDYLKMIQQHFATGSLMSYPMSSMFINNMLGAAAASPVEQKFSDLYYKTLGNKKVPPQVYYDKAAAALHKRYNDWNNNTK